MRGRPGVRRSVRRQSTTALRGASRCSTGSPRRVLLTLFWLLWRPRIEGRERIPSTGLLIVASNHISFIDSIVIPLAVPRKVVFLAKAEYWEGRSPATWPRRLFFAAFEAVPVQREQQQDAQASLDLARGVVERGDAFGI